MITHFQRIIHRHGRWIFLFLLAIIICAFLLWDYGGNASSFGEIKTVKIYGRKVNERELGIAKRLFALVQRQALSADQLEQQVLTQMALLEKARQLGITVSEKEIVTQARQYFTRNDQFDQNLYTEFLTNMLEPRRLTEADFENMIRQELILRKLFTLIDSTQKLTPQQVQSVTEEITEKITISTCYFDSKEYLNQVKPSEEQLAAFYHDNPDRYKTPEKIRVSYVSFPIDPSKITVTDKELQGAYEADRDRFKTDDGKLKPLIEAAKLLRPEVAQQKALDQAKKQAEEFSLKLVPETGKESVSLEVLASEMNLPVKKTDFFASSDTIAGISTPIFAEAAFKLSEDNLISEPVETETAFYVLSFVDKKPSVLQPYEQVKNIVKTDYTQDSALKLARENCEKKRQDVLTLLSEGKTFQVATGQLKLKPQPSRTFSLTDSPPTDPIETAARYASHQLPSGSMSECVPAKNGHMFIYVTSRQKAKPEEIAKFEPQIRRSLLYMQQRYIEGDFQASVLEEAGIAQPKELESKIKDES